MEKPTGLGTPPSPLKARYQLIEQIGSGGMGVVFRAHDTMLERDVAIKFLSPNRLISAEASQRFLREARAVARLSHPNIMAVYDVDREDHWHFLVLEFIPGHDLSGALVAGGGRLPLEQALLAVRGTLEALAYAHQQGVIHRDIKPGNIMLTPAGAVKVADFSLALVQGDMQLTQEGAVVGTMAYLPPEAVLGQRVDNRADLYALGAVFFELLTGTPPYQGEMLTAVVSQILNAPVPRPRERNPDIPPPFEQVIVRLLEKEPDDRYSSAEAVLEALDALAEAVSSPPTASSTEVDATLAESLSLFMERENTASALEAERRRIATLLKGEVIDSLDLLLSQAGIYEQSLGGHPQAQMAASVMASLARQTLQRARDLETRLHPTVLEKLGLEPALEALAEQAIRVHRLRVRLDVKRQSERLPAHIEVAVYRLTQDAFDRAIHHSRASEVSIRLERREARLLLSFSDDGQASTGLDLLRFSRQRIEQIGGEVQARQDEAGRFALNLDLPLASDIDLTPREVEVLRLLTRGLSDRAIARALDIKPRTVNFHLGNIYSKFGVASRTEAAIYALRHGLLRGGGDDPV